MQHHPKYEKTLVIIKPDGIQRSLIGEIVRRYERIGLKLCGIKMLIPTEQMAIDHYYTVGGDEWLEEVGRKARDSYEKKGLQSPYKTNMENGRAVMMSNAKYLSSGPVIAMIWQGNQAIALVRKITGGTEPLSSDVGTIRGDFTLDSYAIADSDSRSVRNLIHASGSSEEFEKERVIWFTDEEILSYTHLSEKILYDINLDGILE
jgi:nucleoside-diphosphate kinase